jgi:hypothetical protein
MGKRHRNTVRFHIIGNAQFSDSSAPFPSTESSQVVTRPSIASAEFQDDCIASPEQITQVKFEDKPAQVPQSSYAALSPNSSQTGVHNCLPIPRNDGPKLGKLVPDSSGPTVFLNPNLASSFISSRS